jgi:hypothetical protein
MHEKPTPPQTILATLVMEAKNPASTRSQANQGITRLYKAEDYYLDLSLHPEEAGFSSHSKEAGLSSHPEEAGLVISGQILPVHASTPSPEGEVWLRGVVEASSPIGPSGGFYLTLAQASGLLRLEVHLGLFTILINLLDQA